MTPDNRPLWQILISAADNVVKIPLNCDECFQILVSWLMQPRRVFRSKYCETLSSSILIFAQTAANTIWDV